MSKPKNNSADPARDHCQTPDYGFEPLIPYLQTFSRRLGRDPMVWEPAAGEGLLVGHIERAGFCVKSGDLLTGQDYFRDSSVPEAYDIQITNVPFSKKYDWIKRAYQQGKPFALLMPADTLFAGDKAVPLFEKYGIEILLPRQRIDYKMPNIGWGVDGKKSQAQFHSAWFTWGLDIGQMLTYVRLLKGRARAKALVQPSLFPMEALN